MTKQQNWQQVGAAQSAGNENSRVICDRKKLIIMSEKGEAQQSDPDNYVTKKQKLKEKLARTNIQEPNSRQVKNTKEQALQHKLLLLENNFWTLGEAQN